jgi:sigma-B regulation protein RsbU (phosphoserine phosphatase)
VKDFLVHFEKQSKRSLLINAYLTVAVVTIADYLLGERLSFFIVYFFPTLIIAWYVGRREGIVIASVSAAGVFLQDISSVHTLAIHSANDIIPYWDFLQRLALFVIFSLTISSLRHWEKEKVEQEFRVAREVQSFMLPRTYPPMSTLSYNAMFKSATTLSGDFYDCIALGRGRLGIVIGDVCGKGTPAALLMAHLHGVMRSHASTGGDDPGALMQTLNASLFSATGSDKFASLFYGVYDDEGRTLTYVNAGHDAPIVFRAVSTGGQGVTPGPGRAGDGAPGGKETEGDAQILRLETEGLLLGVRAQTLYAPKTLQLVAGDIMVFYTDGITDARNSEERTFDESRLISTVTANHRLPPPELSAVIIERVEAFVGDEPQFDDMTLVVAKVL